MLDRRRNGVLRRVTLDSISDNSDELPREIVGRLHGSLTLTRHDRATTAFTFTVRPEGAGRRCGVAPERGLRQAAIVEG